MEGLKVGITGEAKTSVTESNTAIAMGSGGVAVFATPAMIALMENAALSSVAPFLPEGSSTVGISVESSHIAATPLGMEVIAKCELMEIDGKRLVFRVEAYDAIEKIGAGTHERFIVDVGKFTKKIEGKKNK